MLSEGVENQQADQPAPRIPYSGRFEEPEAGLGAALVNLRENGFVEALRPGLDRLARRARSGP